MCFLIGVWFRHTLKRRAARFLWLLLLPLWLSSAGALAAANVWVLEVAGAISPATSDFIVQNLREAQENDAELVVIQLDTPGGLAKSMRTIIKEILASEIPVATWVAPAGSRAASAGTYILYASHIAAMAPATNLGAATPVAIGNNISESVAVSDETASDKTELEQSDADAVGEGKSSSDDSAENELQSKKSDDKKESESDKAGMKKMMNDALAYIRSLAQLRGRNVEWGESAVTEADSLSAEEALAKGVIDFIAGDISALLDQVEGHSIRWDSSGTERVINLSGQNVKRVVPDWRHEFLSFITDPSIAYILLMLGVWGLILEFYSPGIGIAGVTGVICLLIGMFGMQSLPINYAGVALLVVGIALMVTEAFVPSFGVFGVGGATAFVVGSVILLDTDLPGYQISISLIIAVALVSALVFIGGAMLALKAHRRPSVTGAESMLDTIVQVVDRFDDTGLGRVKVLGEIWKAQIDDLLQDAPNPGDRLKITAIDGLILQVTRIDASFDESIAGGEQPA